MTSHHAGPARRRIAVIGGGISGMAAAYHLADRHDVTLIEAAPRLGGHARTVLAGKAGDQPVDTGFIVFNRVNYPGICALFAELDVPIAPSDMSFAASLQGGKIEYGLRTFGTLVAQKSNILRPNFWRMIRDILKFNKHAGALATANDMTIGALLDELRLGTWFRAYYLAPLSGAIWSTPAEEVLDFPAKAFVTFFENHALLRTSGQHQWLTVEGGSIEYVRRIEAAILAKGAMIEVATPVASVTRKAGGATVTTAKGATAYDAVVFATHSDDSLAMLADPTPEEHAALSAVRYQPNEAVLHADARVMPKRRACWSSWNYAEDQGAKRGKIDLTYWMNSLQPIPEEDPLFVTLNSQREIDPDKIYDRVTFRHPVYDRAAWAAQAGIRAIQGQNETWFCGAWMKNGFHEDGYASAAEVATALGAAPQWG